MTTKKKRKKRVAISRHQAVTRLKHMSQLIKENVRIAIWAEAALESANDIVRQEPARRRLGAETYNTVSQSLVLNLAITLARLLERKKKRYKVNKQDGSSIPKLVHLLRQQRCQNILAIEARSWTPHLQDLADVHEAACRRAIKEALEAYGLLTMHPQNRAKVTRLLNFRNERLAHSLMMDALQALPTYDDLFCLLDLVTKFADQAEFAIHGVAPSLADMKEHCREQADLFWVSALQPDGR